MMKNLANWGVNGGGIWRLLVIKEGKGSGVKNVKTKNKNIRTFASEHQDEIFFPAYVFSEKCLQPLLGKR